MKQFSIALAFEDRFYIPALSGFVSNLAHHQALVDVVFNPLKHRLSIFNQNPTL